MPKQPVSREKRRAADSASSPFKTPANRSCQAAIQGISLDSHKHKKMKQDVLLSFENSH
jgi:hypothetical protein